MQKLNPSTCANSQKSQKRHAFLVLYLCLSVFICGSISLLLGQAPAKAPPAREKIDLLVAGGTVVTMDAERRVVEDGAVAVRSDTIVAVGPRIELEARVLGKKRIKTGSKLVMPRPINCHTNPPMTPLLGLKKDRHPPEWLPKNNFP